MSNKILNSQQVLSQMKSGEETQIVSKLGKAYKVKCMKEDVLSDGKTIIKVFKATSFAQ
ncbi:hypothetical protein JWG44_05550 [Leptospira sp. 201903071]|uniref:hypothetical protein n=1 Tax=Leptospira ainazelensis TaxID=2810034 RepID=UPI0019648137|nr:hypothetical protein [Leptospira ainazelensis]MBM9499715.1 hypothetical protein [Leptospira ainazelensis]